MFILLLVLIFLVIDTVILINNSRMIKNHILYTRDILINVDKNISEIYETLNFWDESLCDFLKNDENLEDEED